MIKETGVKINIIPLNYEYTNRYSPLSIQNNCEFTRESVYEKGELIKFNQISAHHLYQLLSNAASEISIPHFNFMVFDYYD